MYSPRRKTESTVIVFIATFVSKNIWRKYNCSRYRYKNTISVDPINNFILGTKEKVANSINEINNNINPSKNKNKNISN